MTVRVYKSSDASAPVWTGAAGSIIALLDACLVNGYGAKTAAGWTKAYTGTNLAAFRQGAGSNARYLRVADSNTGYCQMTGYETMTAVSTGTGPFPTTAQLSGGVYHHKDQGQGVYAPGRPWVVVADEKFVWLWNYTSDTTDLYAAIFGFGDFPSVKSGDVYNTCILGAPGNSYSSYPQAASLEPALTTLAPAKYCARKFDQLGSSILIGTDTDYAKSQGNGQMGTSGLNYPHGPDGGLYLSPVNVHEYNASVGSHRGVLPGMWNPCHAVPFGSFDTWSGSGAFSGKTFIGLRIMSNGCFALETSDTWYA